MSDQSHRDPPSPAARVLLVEDDPDTREALSLFLESQGYAISTAGSAEEGLRLARDDRPDLVLTDFSLPAQTGVWLLEQLRVQNVWPPCGALVASGHGGVRAPDDVPVFQKPVDLGELLRTIAHKLHAKRPPGPRLRVLRAPSAEPPRITLALYICGGSIASERALRCVRRILQSYDGQAYSLEVLDVAQAAEEAARDRVDFTPALVKRSPAPRMWLLGDFSDPTPLRDLLESHGLEPRA